MQRLDPGTFLRLERAAGTRIAVQSGRVWITENGEPDDLFLGAGQNYVVKGQGRVLIEPQGARATAVVDIALSNRRPPPFKLVGSPLGITGPQLAGPAGELR